MNYEKFGAAVTMSVEEIADVVNDHMEEFDVNRVTEMICNIIEQQTEEEQQAIAKAAPIVKITYIAREMYKIGFMYGLYTLNEAMKDEFKEMQARKVERVSNKKAGNNIAEA